MSDARETVNSRVKWSTLSIVLHEQEVVWGTTLDTLLTDGVPLIWAVLCGSWVGKLGRLAKLILNLTPRTRLKWWSFLLGFSDLDQLTTDSLHCKVVSHAVMPLTLVGARAWHRLWRASEAFLGGAKRLHCCGPGFATAHRCWSICLVILRTRDILNSEDVLWSSWHERCSVGSIGCHRSRIDVFDKVVCARSQIRTLTCIYACWESISCRVETLVLLVSLGDIKRRISLVNTIWSRASHLVEILFSCQVHVLFFFLLRFTCRLNCQFFRQISEIECKTVPVEITDDFFYIFGLFCRNWIYLGSILTRARLADKVTRCSFHSLGWSLSSPASTLILLLGQLTCRIIMTWAEWLGKELELCIVGLSLINVSVCITSIICIFVIFWASISSAWTNKLSFDELVARSIPGFHWDCIRALLSFVDFDLSSHSLLHPRVTFDPKFIFTCIIWTGRCKLLLRDHLLFLIYRDLLICYTLASAFDGHITLIYTVNLSTLTWALRVTNNWFLLRNIIVRLVTINMKIYWWNASLVDIFLAQVILRLMHSRVSPLLIWVKSIDTDKVMLAQLIDFFVAVSSDLLIIFVICSQLTSGKSR